MENKALNKIKKLLRLAKSANPHEAAAALSRAQKLMQEHGIESDAPELAGVCDAIITSTTKSQKPALYTAYLAEAVKKAFGCEFYFQPTFTNMEVVFIGHDKRAEITGYVFKVLERQLTKARKEYIAGLSKRMKKVNKTARADQFCEGWVVGVYKKVEAFALSDEEKDQLVEYKNSTELSKSDIRKAKSGGRTGSDARWDGHQASKDVILNRGVNGQETMKLGDCS